MSGIRSGRVFVQLYLEDTIRKSDLNLGIMAEGQRGFAETANAAQRGSNCCGLAALLVESACGYGYHIHVKTRSYEPASRRTMLASGLLILLCGSTEQLGLHLVLEHLADLRPWS